VLATEGGSGSFKGRVERAGKPARLQGSRDEMWFRDETWFEVCFETHARRPEPAAADRTLVDRVLRDLE
jgi:hypothetical protein